MRNENAKLPPLIIAATRKITVGKTYVHETLQGHNYEVQILRRNLKQAKPKSVPRNLIWGIDLTGKTDADRNLYSIFGIIEHLQQAIRLHGKPKIIRTDNEGMFRSSAFAAALEQLGIRHQRTTPGCPWQNGRIERLFGTLKQVLDCWIVSGIAQLNRDLDTFRYWCNHIRPHQNLDGRTPAEAWNGIAPYAKPAKQEHWFEAWDGLLSGYYLRY